jgi:deoxyadenosine/deoxycytidine kinase
MAIKLVAQFDPFLAQHISRYGNSRSGHTSYLSPTIYEDMKLLANKIIHTIVDQIKKCKYFSFIIDSIPDITHIDLLLYDMCMKVS